MNIDDETIEADYDYLSSLENPRALFPCSIRPRSTTGDIIPDVGLSLHVQTVPGVVLIDSGAGPTYTSRKFALKQAG